MDERQKDRGSNDGYIPDYKAHPNISCTQNVYNNLKESENKPTLDVTLEFCF